MIKHQVVTYLMIPFDVIIVNGEYLVSDNKSFTTKLTFPVLTEQLPISNMDLIINPLDAFTTFLGHLRQHKKTEIKR